MTTFLIQDKNKEDGDLYGYYVQEEDIIGVNVERIWHDAKTLRTFIYSFIKTLVHENLHKQIYLERTKNKKQYFNKHKKFTDVGEEYVVNKLNQEVRVGFNNFRKRRWIKKSYSSKSQQM